jgi:D-alanyl-D-alanine carboxypeptidase
MSVGLKHFFHTCLLALSFNTAVNSGVARPATPDTTPRMPPAITLMMPESASPASPAMENFENLQSTSRYAEFAIEVATGKVLIEKNAHTKLHPASTTKLMTAYLVFEALKKGDIQLDQKVRVSPHAAAQVNKQLDLPSGSLVTIENALKGMMCFSANDASVVLAEAIGGSHNGFVEMMNKKAAELGLESSRFGNANGLENPVQRSTAEDMAQLMIAIIRDYPEQYALYLGINKFKFNKSTPYTGFNDVLDGYINAAGVRTGGYPGVDGGKTGYIGAAGYNLVVSGTNTHGQRIVAVVFGAPSGPVRRQKMMDLLDRAFEKLAPPRLILEPVSAPNDSLMRLPPLDIVVPDSLVVKPVIPPRDSAENDNAKQKFHPNRR